MSQILSTDTNNTGLTLGTTSSVIEIRATYTNEVNNGAAFLFDFTGAGNQLILQDYASVISRDGDTALQFDAGIDLTVNAGSSVISQQFAILVQTAGTLNLTNFGRISGSNAAVEILTPGFHVVTNYGELSGSNGVYLTQGAASAQIDNFGVVNAALALSLGGDGDFVRNYGTIIGHVDLWFGADSLFNSGTISDANPILNSGGGNKTITNTGFIGTTVAGNAAITLLDGDDLVTNTGTIIGTVDLGAGADTFDSRLGSINGAVFGNDGNDTLFGSSLNDSLAGGNNDDTLFGFDGADLLQGGTGTNTLSGGNGNDTYFVAGNDTIIEAVGGGVDSLFAFLPSFTLATGVEVETLSGADVLTGNEFAQTLNGSGNNNTLAGGGGADILNGLTGDDTYVLAGEATGVDTVNDTGGTDLITSTITRSLAAFAAIENLTLLGVGNGTGNALANIITGSATANILDGGTGADTLLGNGGNDTLIGGAGIDTETGAAGNDFFVFNAPLSAANRDIITDFNHVADTFRLENAVMTKLGLAGALNPSFFFAGAAAHDADDHVIYNHATGVLSYDSNGSLAGGVTQLATLTNKPVLQANDFVVI